MTDNGTSAEAGFLGADRYADLVMKGGVTSGVIYPRAITGLAERYCFRNIAGTSAGAIAATFAAAAECRRRGGSAEGFERLKALPRWLAAPGRVLQLFRPEPDTRPVLAMALAVFEAKGGLRRKLVAGIASGVRTRPRSLLGALPGLLVLAASSAGVAAEGWGWTALAVCWLGSLILAVLGVVAWLAVYFMRRLEAINGNFFGISSGMAEHAPGETPSLTDWMSEELDAIAGKQSACPLVFGDLWDAPEPAPLAGVAKGRSINLEVVSTNLTHGRPYRLPFDEDVFYFDPDELGRLFPKYVVDWMLAHARESESSVRSREGKTLVPLPEPKDLPVIVATRMSLSFPLLLAAVPLHAVDDGRRSAADAAHDGAARGRQERDAEIADRCWFSDGGISSNFPIHFFDSLIPRWPTFGINLVPFPHGFERGADVAEERKMFLPETTREGLQESWFVFDQGSDVGQLFGFLSAILNAMQNWYDNAFLRLPGYRGRVISIYQGAEEGGLNLNMPPEVIDSLTERGRLAGERLRHQFTKPSAEPLSWDDHRWTRYRANMHALHQALAKIARGIETPAPGDTPWFEMIERGDRDPPPSYRLVEANRDDAREATRALLELHRGWAEVAPYADPPSPGVDLGVTPPM